MTVASSVSPSKTHQILQISSLTSMIQILLQMSRSLIAEVVRLLEKKVSSSMQVDGCRKGTIMYLVEWAGVDQQGTSWEPSWEPACNVNDAAIADFNTK